MTAKKWMAVINLVGIHGPIALVEEENGWWWDKSGNWGYEKRRGARNSTDCYQFVSDNKSEVLAFLAGAKALANRIKANLEE